MALKNRDERAGTQPLRLRADRHPRHCLWAGDPYQSHLPNALENARRSSRIRTGPWPDQETVNVPPGRSTRTVSWIFPQRCAITTAAHAPLPHASVSPTPRSQTLSLIAVGLQISMRLTLVCSGKLGSCSIAGPQIGTGASSTLSTSKTAVDYPSTRRRQALAHRLPSDRSCPPVHRGERICAGLNTGSASSALTVFSSIICKRKRVLMVSVQGLLIGQACAWRKTTKTSEHHCRIVPTRCRRCYRLHEKSTPCFAGSATIS